MIRFVVLLLIFSFNIESENSSESLEKTIIDFWEARNEQNYEKIFFYESKIGAITGSSSENHFYDDPPPDLKSVINYYSTVESNLAPSHIKVIKLSEKVYLALYYLTGTYKYSSGKFNDSYQARTSNIWLYEDGGFKLYYKNFSNLKKELEPEDIVSYPMD
mgnify:FL=1|tara:strand:+ start:2012 stop:2494 length:483 start_codon:yes stop_codon:yes gene_type:complete